MKVLQEIKTGKKPETCSLCQSPILQGNTRVTVLYRYKGKVESGIFCTMSCLGSVEEEIEEYEKNAGR